MMDSLFGTVLDNTSHEQLYYQLYNILFQNIVEGVYKVGDLLPSEPTLVDYYGISRATVRKSMELLVTNGLVERRRGVGSVVISNQPSSALNKVASYLKRTVTDDGKPFKKVISAHDIKADDKLAMILCVATDIKLFELKRVRYGGNTSFYLETVYVVHSYLPDIHKRDFSKESLRSYYFDIMHKRWVRATQHICAEVASANVAKQLQIEPGSPILTIYRVTYDQNNIPREYMIKHYRADKYYLVMNLEN